MKLPGTVFLMRMIGVEPEQQKQVKRFKDNLNGFDRKQSKLSDLEEQLHGIVLSVEEQQDSIRARPSSAMSGEHQLDLAVGGKLVGESGST